MKNFLIPTMILSGILTFSANAEDFGGKLYVEDATIAPGGTAVLSVQLDGNSDVSGFQFQMNLPVGIAYQSWSMSEGCLPMGASVSDMLTIQRFQSNKLTIAGVLNSSAGVSFTRARGELAQIIITASPNIPKGTYLVELRGIDVCDPLGNDYTVPSTTFTLTVGEPSGIETLYNESGNAQIYDLQGRRQNEVSTGQAGIVNGRAVYRK